MSFYKDHQLGELSSRATEDISKLQPLFISLIAPVFQNILFIAGSLTIMFFINWYATLIVLGLIILIIPVILLFSRKIRVYSASSQQKHSDANAFMEETLFGIREIKSFVLEKLKLVKIIFNIVKPTNRHTHVHPPQPRARILSLFFITSFGSSRSGASDNKT